LTVWAAIGRSLSPVEERPRAPDGLESATYRTRSGAEYVVVHNPATRTYARLDPREFDLLALMDGRRSVKELVIAYYQRHGVLALARVAGLVRLLHHQRLLQEGGLDVYARLGSLLRGNAHHPSSGELTTSSVDGHLGEAYRVWGRFFFHRAWLFVGLALGVIGPLLVVYELQRGRYALYAIGGSAVLAIALLVIMALVALAVHEVGHGLAVKHAGRRVHEAGIRLYFGLPAAFVDTTDIWMAPPLQRLLTAFAGPWTGLMLGGLCAIGATLVDDSRVGTFLFTAAFVFLVDNLFNFNPLLELDGYYMLVDFLDRPLLRARSMAFVRGPLWSRLWRREGLAGEQRLLALFGLGAVVYAVLAVLLAIRAWQALLVPLIADNLVSGDLPRQIVGLLILIAVAVPLTLAGFGVLRRLAAPIGERLEWLSGRAAEHRHREALTALRAVPLWSELPAGRLLEVARAMRTQNVTRGAEVVRQGDAGDRFYLIASGEFEVFVDGVPDTHLGRGDFFGERALLHRAPRAATVVATQDGRLFALERADFDALLASDLAVRARIEASLAYREEVSTMPLFHDLSPGELDVLLARLEPLAVEAGEVVIEQGEPGDRFYVVRSGQVEVTRDGLVLARLGRGDAFGEIALLLDVPRTATVTALESTMLLTLDADGFRDVLAGYLGRSVELERLSHLRLLSHKRLDEVV
jgi:CRP-like cAMP-binding protein